MAIVLIYVSFWLADENGGKFKLLNHPFTNKKCPYNQNRKTGMPLLVVQALLSHRASPIVDELMFLTRRLSFVQTFGFFLKEITRQEPWGNQNSKREFPVVDNVSIFCRNEWREGLGHSWSLCPLLYQDLFKAKGSEWDCTTTYSVFADKG